MTRRAFWLGAAGVMILALAASANSIFNGFAYDDIYVLQRDAQTATLDGWWKEFASSYWRPVWGGDGYRPLARILFRFQWALGDGNPMVFHAVNIAVHVVTAAGVFWLATLILPFAAAWVAAALFAVHPVHVEAVANIVGQAELMVAALIVMGTALYVSRRRERALSPREWGVILALYATACLFKEHAIVFPALLLLAEFTVIVDRAPWRARLQRMRLPLLALTLVAVTYLWARTTVVKGLTGFTPAVPFQTLEMSQSDRVLTMIGAAPEWFRLLLWPQRLMTDYAPPYIDMAEGVSMTQLPGLLLLLGTLGLAVATWRRSPVTAFGIAWIVVTLLPSSNFIVPAGIIIAERTLFLPSVGAMLAVCSAIPWLYARFAERRWLIPAGAAAVAVLLALGLARSHGRNAVWKSNETLLGQGVKDAPNNYRVHYLWGTHLFETGRKVEGERHYREAIRLFPYDPFIAFQMAEQYRKAGICAPAIPLYNWAFEVDSTLRRGEVGLAGCLFEYLRLDEAKESALRSIRFGGRFATARNFVRAADAGRDSLAARRARGEPIHPVNGSP